MYFNKFAEIDETRNTFRKLCLTIHPDKGGDHAAFVEMKNEYEEALKFASKRESRKAADEMRKTNFDFTGEVAIMEAIENLMKIHGIEIEICGTWILVGGDTRPVHEQIKALSFRFSSNKKLWYWSPYMQGYKKRGRKTMKQIRSEYGSYKIMSDAEERKQLV